MFNKEEFMKNRYGKPKNSGGDWWVKVLVFWINIWEEDETGGRGRIMVKIHEKLIQNLKLTKATKILLSITPENDYGVHFINNLCCS